MKKPIVILFALLSGFVFLNFSTATTAIEVPENVQQIIDKSCYTCHSDKSKDSKAKERLNFDKLKYLKSYQAMAKWDEIAEVAVNDEMPPKKFKKKNRSKVLTGDDLNILTTWVNNMTDEPAQPKANLDNQLENLINQIVSSLAQNDKSKIAVMDFVNMNGEITKLGRYMSEELTTRLYLTGKFEVIERKLLDKIIEEQKISLSGMIDETTAAELGRVLGVDAIASGTITDLGTSVKVNARLISAESGKLFSVASVEIPKNDKVKVLLSQHVATTNATTDATKTNATTGGDTQEYPAIQTKKIDGYIFELFGAWYFEDVKAVTCGIRVINTTEDPKDFEVITGKHYRTMIYTDAGDESVFQRIQIGSKMNTVQGGYYSSVVKKIFPDTPEELGIIFYNISPKSTKINQLQIKTRGFNVEFRNIPLIKE